MSASSTSRIKKGVSALALAMLGFTSLRAADDKPIPDPAAHSVIVPYDGAKPLDLTKSNRFYLDYAQFQHLWDLAKENRRPEKVKADDGKPEASISSAMYDARIMDDKIVVAARLQVMSRGQWSKLSLKGQEPAPPANPQNVKGGKGASPQPAVRPPSPGSLLPGELTVDGKPAALQAGEVLIEKPGAHLVEWKFTVPMTKGWTTQELAVPSAAANLLRVTAPMSEGAPRVGASASSWPTDLATLEDQDGRHVVTVPLGSSPTFAIFRQPFRKPVADAPPAIAENSLDLQVKHLLEQVDAKILFKFPGTERDRFTVRLDGSLKLTSWQIPGLKEWALRTDKTDLLVDFTLMNAVADQLEIRVMAERVLDRDDGTRNVAMIAGEGMKKSSSLVVHYVEGLQVKVQAGNLQRVATGASVNGLVTGEAYRLNNGDKLSYNVSPAGDRSASRVEAVYQLSAQKAEIIAVIGMDTGRAALQEARIGLPAGFEVQTLTGPRVQSWHREGDDLLIRLDAASVCDAKLVLHVAKTLKEPSPSWKLEPLKLPQFKKHEGTTLIAVHAADDVKLEFDAANGDVREVDPASLQTPLSVAVPLAVKRALVVKKQDWSANVTLTRQTPKFAVDAALLAQATDEGLKLSQQIGVIIEQGMLNSVKLRLPKELPEARVLGPLVRDAQSSFVGDKRVYDVTFQADVLERVDFSLDFELPLIGEKTLPVLEVEGADRARRFLIVDNVSAHEMKTTANGAESVVKESLPYVPDTLQRPVFYRAGDNAKVVLTFSQLESTAGNAAIVTLAEITTALRPNGERWDTVVYSLANRSLQFLPVKLAPGAELIEVSVGGQTVRADAADSSVKASASKTYLVPLIQMRPGELSQQVKLVYKLSIGSTSEGTHSLNDPELVGLSAERTLWNVWMPERFELKKWDGNVEEVNAEVREYEKKHELLADWGRLNRVLSSKDAKQEDRQMAFDNANKLRAQLKTSKPQQSFNYRADSGEAKGKKAAAKEVEFEQVEKAKQEVDKAVKEQSQLLDFNGGALQVEQRQQIPQQAQQKTVQQGALGNGILSNGGNANWNSQTTGQINITNGNSLYFSKNGVGTLILGGNNIAVNDNINVDQGALAQPAKPAAGKEDDSKKSMSDKSGLAKAVPVQEPAATQNVIANNARANTYAGATNVNQGSLSVQNAGAVSNSTVIDVSGNGVVTFGTTSGTTANGSVTVRSGTQANVPILGGWANTGNNSYTGTTVANAGTLSVQNSSGLGVVTGTGGVAVGNGEGTSSATLGAGQSNLTINGVISGSSGETKSGAGTLILSGGNTYTGGTVVSKGTLNVEMGNRAGTNAVTPDSIDGLLQSKPTITNSLGKEDQGSLRADKYSLEGRRALEKTEQQKGEYYDASRDQQRAKMLNQVSSGWEEKLPAVVSGSSNTRFAGNISGTNGAVATGTIATAKGVAADPFAAAPATPAPPPANETVGSLALNGGKLGYVGAGESAARVPPDAKPVSQPPTPASQRGVVQNSSLTVNSLTRQAGATVDLNGRSSAFGDLNQPQAAPAARLKPVGRVSLAVDVPLTGTVHHFRKLKDHALVEVTVAKPLTLRQTNALWFLIIGGAIVLLIEATRKWRRSRNQAA